MAEQALSKAALGRARARLAAYRRFLPSLDLKRQQLIAQRNRARQQLDDMAAEREALVRTAGEAVPMLAMQGVSLEGLARIEGARYGGENVVGVILPVVDHVEVAVQDYGLLVEPHWVDRVAELLVQALRLEVELTVARERVVLLEQAVKKVTQRVNLFEKVLIPRTQAHIRKIQIYLGDAERAGVVTAKLAKSRQAVTA